VQENENCVAKEIKQEEGKQSLVESEDSSLTIQLIEISENSSEDKKKLKSKLNLSEKTYQEDVRMKNSFIYLFATKIIKNYNIQFTVFFRLYLEMILHIPVSYVSSLMRKETRKKESQQ